MGSQETEWENESLLFPTQDAEGAFASVLKLPAGCRRGLSSSANLENADVYGSYWSSIADGINARMMRYSNPTLVFNSYNRAYGFSVRCLKE